MTTDRTSYAVKTQIDALGHEGWNVGVRSDKGMMNKTWTTKELTTNVPWLKSQNALGAHIYIRPSDDLPHSIILIDDLKSNDIDRLKISGYHPALVIETSPNNHQVWVRLPNSPMSTEERTVCAKDLAEKFNGDLNSADGKHYGRLAGFTNQKPEYKKNGLQPFVKVIEALGKVCVKEFVLVQQKMKKEFKPVGGIPSTEHKAINQSDAKREYQHLANEILQKYHKPDLSRLDFMIAKKMIAKKFSFESIEDAMRKVSHNLIERKIGHADDYIRRTVAKAADAIMICRNQKHTGPLQEGKRTRSKGFGLSSRSSLRSQKTSSTVDEKQIKRHQRKNQND